MDPADIEGPANELLLSPTEEQRRAAVASDTVSDVTTTPNPAQPQVSAPERISSDKLNPDQRQALTRLVRAYAANFPDPIRTDPLDQITRHDRTVHFARYGPPDAARPHAFRVRSPTSCIDFDDKQNGANHIHTYDRSLVGDFGMPIAR